MKFAILADIHANLEALNAVTRSLPDNLDGVFCLGDLVGYGPNPNECIIKIRKLAKLTVLGNHDLGCLDSRSWRLFHPSAAEVISWTSRKLSSKNKEFLANLKAKTSPTRYFTLVHAAPREPIWEYILNYEDAVENFPTFSTPICFFGHTHLPVIWQKTALAKEIYFKENQPMKLDAQSQYLINPGSIGQPRDGNSKSSYLIYDQESNTITFHRVQYDYLSTQEKMRRFGFPRLLIDRLAQGR